VLDETNVEFFLSTEEGAQEVSPLAVSFYMGLCKGKRETAPSDFFFRELFKIIFCV